MTPHKTTNVTIRVQLLCTFNFFIITIFSCIMHEEETMHFKKFENEYSWGTFVTSDQKYNLIKNNFIGCSDRIAF